jgi:hypothetical protein
LKASKKGAGSDRHWLVPPRALAAVVYLLIFMGREEKPTNCPQSLQILLKKPA